ncbi:MAG: hypothetical protein Q8R38_06735 [Candidatus Omnitrophota bacterium]|nr:hypothetical protein [Candidatus Omnitrophota bacterium]
MIALWYLVLFTILAAAWLVILLIITGLIRLFIFGWSAKPENVISDISVLKKGDIILTGKASLADSWYIQLSNALTRKLKHRFWTHAAIYRGNGMLWEAQPEGIIEKDINIYLKNGYLIRAFRHKYIQDNDVIDKVLKFCEEQKGFKYGWGGLIFYVVSTFVPISFNFIFENKIVDEWCHMDKAYFCSELIVDAFDEAGHPVSPYDGWRVKPSDFISNPVLEIIK